MDTTKQLAQVINDSFFAMQAGEMPTKEEQSEPNAGDMQLAVDIIGSDWYDEVIKNAYDRGVMSEQPVVDDLRDKIAQLEAVITEARSILTDVRRNTDNACLNASALLATALNGGLYRRDKPDA